MISTGSKRRDGRVFAFEGFEPYKAAAAVLIDIEAIQTPKVVE